MEMRAEKCNICIEIFILKRQALNVRCGKTGYATSNQTDRMIIPEKYSVKNVKIIQNQLVHVVQENKDKILRNQLRRMKLREIRITRIKSL